MSKPELHINVDAAHEDHGVEVDENDDDMYSDESSVSRLLSCRLLAGPRAGRARQGEVRELTP